MEDQSIFTPNNTNADSSILSGGQTNNADQEYVNQCIKEVCHRGDSLQKYQRMIEKKFNPEFYKKCENFVEEVKRSVDRKKFSNTSVTNLKYLANEIHVPIETVDSVVNHYSKQFADEERRKAEAERRRLEAIAERERQEAERKKREEEEERQRQLRMAEEAEKERKRELTLKILKWVGIVVGAGLAIWGIIALVMAYWPWIVGGIIVIGIIYALANR
jgi:cation transport ATPase